MGGGERRDHGHAEEEGDEEEGDGGRVGPRLRGVEEGPDDAAGPVVPRHDLEHGEERRGEGSEEVGRRGAEEVDGDDGVEGGHDEDDCAGPEHGGNGEAEGGGEVADGAEKEQQLEEGEEALEEARHLCSARRIGRQWGCSGAQRARSQL